MVGQASFLRSFIRGSWHFWPARRVQQQPEVWPCWTAGKMPLRLLGGRGMFFVGCCGALLIGVPPEARPSEGAG